MKKSILLLLLGIFVGCKQGMMIDDMAARLSGLYVVKSYVVNGDTLFVSAGVNKIDVKEFYIYVDRKASDSLYISTSFKKIDSNGSSRFIRDVGIKESNGLFQLSDSSDYEGSITNQIFHERTRLGKGGGFLILPSSSPLPTTSDPALEGVFIVAEKFLKE